MSNTPTITYASRPEATPEGELSALAAVYRFILDCNAKKKAALATPTTQRRSRMIAPTQRIIQGSPQESLIIFDSRIPGTGCRLSREMYASRSCASIERLGQHHSVMIVRLGGAQRIAR